MSKVKEGVNKIIENIPRLIESKRRLKAYIKQNGTLKGFDDKSVKLVKPI